MNRKTGLIDFLQVAVDKTLEVFLKRDNATHLNFNGLRRDRLDIDSI